MSSVPILYLLLPLALLLAGAAIFGFLWAVRHGQYDDVETPALRFLVDDEQVLRPEEHTADNGGSSPHPTMDDGNSRND